MVEKGRGSRSYRSPLRERRAAETRLKVLEATARIIANQGVGAFSIRAVASGAGVGERTVYHHFPDRQALLDGLADWVEDLIIERDVRIDIVDTPDLPAALRQVYGAFDEIGAPAVAVARLMMGDGIRSAGHRRRTEAFRERLGGAVADVAADEVERRVAVLRNLASVTTWLALRESGLSAGDAASAAEWAFGRLVSP